MRNLFTFTILFIAAVFMVTSCGNESSRSSGTSKAVQDDDNNHEGHDDDAAKGYGDLFGSIKQAVCVLIPTKGNETRGKVSFSEKDGKVTVVAHITGLNPGSHHAIHIHQYGDVSGEDGKSAGGHYNPQGHDHALPDKKERHAGDFGNLQADDNGMAHFEIVVDNISVAGLVNPIIGRGMIVHAKPDDGGQPTGNAGARIAMGVIGIAKSDP